MFIPGLFTLGPFTLGPFTFELFVLGLFIPNDDSDICDFPPPQWVDIYTVYTVGSEKCR